MLILILTIQLNTYAIIERVDYLQKIVCTIPHVENVAIELNSKCATKFKDYYLAVYIELTADKRRTIVTFSRPTIFK